MGDKMSDLNELSLGEKKVQVSECLPFHVDVLVEINATDVILYFH